MRIDSLRATIFSRLAVIDHCGSVRDAASALSRRGIGLVVVCDASGRSVGVLSKSDLIRHLADPASPTLSVAALMSRSVTSCLPHDDLHAVWQVMTARELQNVPVFDSGGRPVGVLDIRDAMKTLIEQEEMQERMLENYVAGIGYR